MDNPPLDWTAAGVGKRVGGRKKGQVGKRVGSEKGSGVISISHFGTTIHTVRHIPESVQIGEIGGHSSAPRPITGAPQDTAPPTPGRPITRMTISEPAERRRPQVFSEP